MFFYKCAYIYMKKKEKVSFHFVFFHRYGVRGCFRHLCYLNDLLDRIDRGLMIDPTLIHFSFAFCATHVYGNRTDRVGSITHEEKEKFQDIKERLRQILEEQITNFRYKKNETCRRIL